jgi:hypothetical protein
MQCAGTIVSPAEVPFFLRLHGLWEGVIDLPPPPDPPFEIEPLWQAIRESIPDDDAEPDFDLFDQRLASRKPVEIPSKTVPSSSSTPTDAAESAAPEITAAKNFEK